MAKGNPEPWFRKNRNTWYVTLGCVQHNLKTADREQAFRLWHEMMARPSESPPDPRTLTVVTALALFADWSSTHNEAATHGWYCGYLTGFVRSISRDLLLADLRPFHLTKWIDSHKQWGPSSQRAAITAVKRAVQWAADQGYVDSSPIRAVRKPKPQRRTTVLSAEQRQLILAEASDQAFRDLITLTQETGARPQELRTVQARHVDLKKGVWHFPPSEHKTGKPRIVYLNETALEISRRLLERYPTGPLLRNSEGEPWTRNAIRCRFRRLRHRLKDQLPADLCAYLFRHTFVTDALVRKVDPITLAQLVGHTDLTMINQVYQHLEDKIDHMRDAARQATTAGKPVAEGGE